MGWFHRACLELMKNEKDIKCPHCHGEGVEYSGFSQVPPCWVCKGWGWCSKDTLNAYIRYMKEDHTVTVWTPAGENEDEE